MPFQQTSGMWVLEDMKDRARTSFFFLLVFGTVNLSRYLLKLAAMMGFSAISDPHKAAGLQSKSQRFMMLHPDM